MTRLRAALALATGLLAGCGGGDGGPGGGDDSTPPTIVTTTPVEGALHVAVVQPITVSVDESLDPATVTAATVKLGVTSDTWPFQYATGSPDMMFTDGPGGSPVSMVFGAVTYDDGAKTITFTPAAPLVWGHQYTLTLSGVTDVRGNALADSTVHFITSFNGATRLKSWTTAGQPNSYVEYTLDAAGLLTKQLDFTGPGGDTSWYTTDDYVGQNLELAFLPDGRVSRAFKMQAGNDGKLNTSDDYRLEVHQYNYDADGRYFERFYAQSGGEGADQMFGTPDDVVSNLFRYQYDGEKLAGYVSYFLPGADMTWRTGDDICDYYWTYTYDADLRRTRETNTWCGLDRVQSTDDIIQYYHDNTYDPATGSLVMRTKRSIGVDNIPYNGDDDYQFIEKYEVDSAGRVTAYTRYNAAGGDSTWNTTDDVVQTLVRTTYGTSGLPSEVTSYSAGVISGYTTYAYDAAGNRTNKTTYHAGSDATFKTSDDVMATSTEFDTAH
jgi:hypothetical protein